MNFTQILFPSLRKHSHYRNQLMSFMEIMALATATADYDTCNVARWGSQQPSPPVPLAYKWQRCSFHTSQFAAALAATLDNLWLLRQKGVEDASGSVGPHL